jgi:predicted dehydrogenase
MTSVSSVPAAGPARYGIVGSGWRTGFFLRLARAMPERFTTTGIVTRTAERGDEVEKTWNVPTFRTVKELVAADRPDFVIVSVPWEAAPAVTVQLVELNIPVLTETPPAPDLPGLRELWATVGASGRVQVAEQYLLMPAHAARRAVLRRGAIGQVTSVQVSSTHLYHAVSMIRMMLDSHFDTATVTASTFTAPLADPLSREGWTGGTDAKPASTTFATIDFGKGRTGLYDFTDNQWFNPLRSNRIVVRGSHGELVDDRVVRLADATTAVESHLIRRQTGIDLNLEGFDLDHISFNGQVVYRNPYQGARLAEDDISVATMLEQMAAWSRGDAEQPYPLAQGCQDHLISLAIEESARTGQTISTLREAWAS